MGRLFDLSELVFSSVKCEKLFLSYLCYWVAVTGDKQMLAEEKGGPLNPSLVCLEGRRNSFLSNFNSREPDVKVQETQEKDGSDWLHWLRRQSTRCQPQPPKATGGAEKKQNPSSRAPPTPSFVFSGLCQGHPNHSVVCDAQPPGAPWFLGRRCGW